MIVTIQSCLLENSGWTRMALTYHASPLLDIHISTEAHGKAPNIH